MRVLLSAEGWAKAYRFISLRYKKKPRPAAANEPEQYQLFDTPEYTYRVFITNMKRTIDLLVWFYDQRAGAENLIKEANNDAGLAAYPSGRWLMNCNHFPVGDAGLQSELLVDAVQSRGTDPGSNAETHHVGDSPSALSLSRGQDLASRRQGGRQLQRSLC
jgi:hypothetical protein